MRRNDVDHQLQSAIVDVCDQIIKIYERSVFRIDVTIIRDIIAKVFLRRLEEWADSNCINAEISNVIQSRNDPAKITNSIAI